MPSSLSVVLLSFLLAITTVIFWLWLLVQPIRGTIDCPEKCRCDDLGIAIKCSDSGLNDIPSILPTQVRILVINGNNITIFENDTFVSKGLIDLEVLEADFCRIRKIDLGAFNGITKLTHLSVQGNEISDIIPGTFQMISSLKYLDLKYNKIERWESDVFRGLVILQIINLEGNMLQNLHPDTFSGLKNLQYLYLRNNSDLQTPTDRHFIYSHSLKHLSISGCNVSSVSVETFANVSALEWLDLSYNYLRSVNINILNLLPELTKLHLHGNKISKIIPGTFQNFSRLENLSLGYNEIKVLGSDTFCGLVNLNYIDLQGTKLQYLHPDTFVGLQYLQNLDLSKNPDLQIPTDHHFINSFSLKSLDVSYSNIRSVSVETFANVSALEWLDLSYNFLRILDINIFQVLPELTELYLNDNEISKIIPGTFENFSLLEYLYLAYNEIEVLESDTFCGLVNLNYIDLEGNQLQYINPDAFVRLPNLQLLDLTYNPDLQILTDIQFINSHSLKHLSIQGCNVSSVSVETFANVSALEWLDLSYNFLRILDINILKVLPELSTIYLHDNPLQCDCQFQEVGRWCQDHNIQTAYKKSVPICDTPSEVKGIWWGVLEKGECLQDNIQYYGDYKNSRYSSTHIEDMDKDTKMDTHTVNEQRKSADSVVKQYELPVSAVLLIFGTTGNVILIIIIICNKDMRNVPNMYIFNLAISDIIYLTVLFLRALTERISVTWLSGEISCAFFSFWYEMSVKLTAYSVAVLSIQRYRVIVNPLSVHVSSQPTWRGTGAIICGVWILAALFTVPAARLEFICSISVLLSLTNYYQQYRLFHLLVSCVFPLCVIAFSYIMSARHLVKSSCSFSEGTQNHQRNTRTSTAKIVLGLTVVFLISYVPHHTLQTYFFYSINFHNTLEELAEEFFSINNLLDVLPITKLLLSINSCLNPVALFCTSLAFRRHFKRYLICCCKTKSPPTVC
jgi:Leucine-rich repeat (LRR) protein